jgi:hypothetical protein
MRYLRFAAIQPNTFPVGVTRSAADAQLGVPVRLNKS